MALVHRTVIETKRFAERKGRGDGEHAACHRAGIGNELGHFSGRLADKYTQPERACYLQKTRPCQGLTIESGQMKDHPRLDSRKDQQIQPWDGNGARCGGERAVADDAWYCPACMQIAQLLRSVLER